jgi:hypothetical protein
VSGSSFRRGKTFTDPQIVQQRAKRVVPKWSLSKRPWVLGLFNNRSGVGEVALRGAQGHR